MNQYDKMNWNERGTMTTVKLEAKGLQDVLSWANKINSKKTSMREAETVFLSLEQGILTASGFDGSAIFSASTETLEVSDNRVRKASIATSAVASLLKVLRTSEVRIDFEEKELRVHMPRVDTTIPYVTVRRQSTPETPESVGTLLSNDIKKALGQVSIAVSSDAAAVALTGVLFEFSPSKKTVSLVACDRFQLAIKKVKYEPVNETAEDFSILLPYSDLRKLFVGVDDDTTLAIHAKAGHSFFGIESVDTRGFINTYQNDYVNYQQFLKLQFSQDFTVKKSDFKSALSDVVAFGSLGDPVRVKVSGTVLTIASQNESAVAEVDITTSSSGGIEEEVEFSFSPEYLLKSLNSLDSTVFRWKYIAFSKPVVFREVTEAGNDRDSWYYLVMPITRR